MFTLSSQHKKVKVVSGLACFPTVREVAGLGHVLVLVFAATRKEMALPTNQRGDRRHVGSFYNLIRKSMVYATFSHNSIETKQKCT